MPNKAFIIFAGLLAFFVLLIFPLPLPLSETGHKTTACVVIMVMFWLTEAIPIPVTALLPIILFPFLGILNINEVSVSYSHPIVFLFMGGFILALALEKWNLHRRLALYIIKLTGSTSNGILLGFTVSTAFLSMWISNTATAVIMLPMALSIIALFEQTEKDPLKFKNFSLGLTLMIAYAANIGGMATLIGTPPNIVLKGLAASILNIELDFTSWLLMAFPIVVILLAATFLLVTRVFYPAKIENVETTQILINQKYQELGKMSLPEKLVITVFSLTALAWIFRLPINELLKIQVLNDTNIAMTGALSLFFIPGKSQRSSFLMTWKDMDKFPWGILLLFGGGLALAAAMEKTGVVEVIGRGISNMGFTSGIVVIFIVTAIMLFMTELMSNVALCTVFLPMVFGISEGLEMSPLLLAIPVTLASSCAFMLPMGTPPNAIVFAGGYIKIREMARVGIFLNLIAVVVIVILGNLLITTFII